MGGDYVFNGVLRDWVGGSWCLRLYLQQQSWAHVCCPPTWSGSTEQWHLLVSRATVRSNQACECHTSMPSVNTHVWTPLSLSLTHPITQLQWKRQLYLRLRDRSWSVASWHFPQCFSKFTSVTDNASSAEQRNQRLPVRQKTGHDQWNPRKNNLMQRILEGAEPPNLRNMT